MKHTDMLASRTEERNYLSRLMLFIDLKKEVIIELIALLFVILFLYTGISKLMDFMLFEEQLLESPILAPVAPLVAWGLPVIEFVVSVLLFIPRFRLKGLYASLVLMILFTIYVGALLMFSSDLPCSCGGILELLSWPAHLVVNTILTGLAWLAIKLARD